MHLIEETRYPVRLYDAGDDFLLQIIETDMTYEGTIYTTPEYRLELPLRAKDKITYAQYLRFIEQMLFPLKREYMDRWEAAIEADEAQADARFEARRKAEAKAEALLKE